MCVVSQILDYGKDRWSFVPPYTLPNNPVEYIPLPTKEELEEFRRLIEAARRFDEATGQPDCELDEKLEWLKDLEARVRKLEAKDKVITHGPVEEEDIKYP